MGAAGDLALLRLLQLADSGFPSGAYTLSNGLETLVADGAIASAEDLAAFVRVHLLAKFARSDLIALLAAHDAGDESENTDAGATANDGRVERIVAIDRRLTAAQ